MPDTMAEAVYNVLVYHAVVRLSPFVEMVTHSATVNHGGGLRKVRERVFANPCHFAQSMFADLNGTLPVALSLQCATQTLPRVLPDVDRAGVEPDTVPILDAVAAVDRDGALLISIAHRGRSGPVQTTVSCDGLQAPSAEVETLSAEVPWAKNTMDAPGAVVPVESQATVSNGQMTIELPACSVTLVRVPTG
jgi:alpha-N-arabinofuranosidase